VLLSGTPSSHDRACVGLALVKFHVLLRVTMRCAWCTVIQAYLALSSLIATAFRSAPPSSVRTAYRSVNAPYASEHSFQSTGLSHCFFNHSLPQYASLVSQFVSKSRSVVRQLDESNELQFVRIRSLRHEIMVATDREYTLIIIQDPS
jgi:hypothetical protein